MSCILDIISETANSEDQIKKNTSHVALKEINGLWLTILFLLHLMENWWSILMCLYHWKKSTAISTTSKTSFFLKNAFKIKRNNTICRNCPLSNQVDFIGDKDDGFVDFQFVSDFVEVIFGNLEGWGIVDREHYDVSIHTQGF